MTGAAITGGLFLGDAAELIKRVPDGSVDLVATDPPYKIEGYEHGAGISRNRENVRQIREMGITDGFDPAILGEFLRVLRAPRLLIWCNKEQIYDYIGYFAKKRGLKFEILIWHKTNPIPFTSGHWLKDKEYCLCFWGKGARIEVGYRDGATVIDTPTNQADRKIYGHPTIKPQPIMERLIAAMTAPGDIVLDPFMGSGTTCAAAKAIGRRWIGFERDPRWHAVAEKRLGGAAEDARDGEWEQMSLL